MALKSIKNVKYVEFDSHPDLKQLAEQATTTLAGLIKDWWDEIDVTWAPAPPGLEVDLVLMLSLALPNASGVAAGHFRRRDFEPGEDGELRWKLRETWLGLLDRLNRGNGGEPERVVFRTH